MTLHDSVNKNLYIIQYTCYRCNSTWNDVHDSLVDDECCYCGARAVTPLASTQLGKEDDTAGADEYIVSQLDEPAIWREKYVP